MKTMPSISDPNRVGSHDMTKNVFKVVKKEKNS